MAERRRLRIFLSSPADVRPERLIGQRVVERLAREFAYQFRLESVMWEREPLVASAHPQDRIVPPHDTDIVVVILWSRLGVRLPIEKYVGAMSGRAVTGTEWEFEDALAAYHKSKLPDLLLYRKRAPVSVTLDDERALQEQLQQKRDVEDFMTRWTRSADGVGFTAAAWEFDTLPTFEQMLEGHLRELIRRQIKVAPDGDFGIHWHEGSPFRGLSSFEPEHAPVFFGRTRARNELRELLVRQEARSIAFVMVVGASGSGKSSLVKAGLLPDVQISGMVNSVALCRYAIMRPSDDEPLRALAAALLQPAALPELSTLEYDVQSLYELIRASPGKVTLPIKQGLAAAAKSARLVGQAEARLLVFVDQLEELFTSEKVSQESRTVFVAALEALSKSGQVWVVTTLRSDFFDRLETLTDLLALSAGEARYLLTPPERGEIAQMIRQPAREGGLRYERDAARDVGLDDEILEAAARDRNTLPLLSFLLDQLWKARDEAGTLTFDAYKRLGGFEGSLGQRADEVYAAQPADVQATLPNLLRTLVSVSPSDHLVAARPAPRSLFKVGSPERALVDALVAERLLVVDGDESGEPQVHVAHEALLTHWKAARDFIAKESQDLQLRVRLDENVRVWQAAAKQHKAALLLAPGLPLSEARDLVRRWQGGLRADVVDYVRASQVARWRRWAILAAAGIGAIALVPISAYIVTTALIWSGVRDVENDLQLVRIPAGCYQMGSPERERDRIADESPRHEVCLQAFDLGKFEVTQAQWSAVMLQNPSQYVGDDNPVENVSWEDTQRFLARMNEFGRREYRLPSEAEREYAARAGGESAFAWGSRFEPDGCRFANTNDQTFAETAPTDPLSTQAASCSDGQYRTAPVGQYEPNAWGLYDMTGNVWEWVADEYHPTYEDAPVDGSAWEGARRDGVRVLRVLRGGSWHSIPRRTRVAVREKEPSDYRIGYTGFRVAASVSE